MARLPPSRRPDIYRQTSNSHDDPAPYHQEYIERQTSKVYRKGKKKIRKDRILLEDDEVYDMSLAKAMFLTVWKLMVYNNSMNSIAQILRLTAPLTTKLLITSLTTSHTLHQASLSSQIHDRSLEGLEQPRSVGFMVGVAVGLWAMLLVATLLLYHTWFEAAIMGKKLSSALVMMIGRKSTRLSGRSRLEMTDGRLTTMLSVDCSAIERFCTNTLDITATPLSLILGVTLLIHTIGPSALSGLLVLFFAGPLKVYMFQRISRLKKEQSGIVDRRVKVLGEVLGRMKAVKMYGWESIWERKVEGMRKEELDRLRANSWGKAGLSMFMGFVPTLAAIMTFVTYSLSGHELDAGIVFAALQYFNVLRAPITLLPQSLSALSEAKVAVGKYLKTIVVYQELTYMRKAEEHEGDIEIDPASPYGLVVEDAEFQCDSSAPQASPSHRRHGHVQEAVPSPTAASDVIARDKSFTLKDIDLRIPRGCLVCILGPIGAGKSALLKGLIKEMKMTKGDVVFGGTVSYVPQHDWVQSGTIRDIITFSCSPEDIDDKRLEEVIDACALRSDLAMMPQGVLTYIGERGVTLSGGQRQRLCIARATYAQTSVVLLDDPLSAVDAHVSEHLVQHCILGTLADRTRLLVTHSLEVLPYADMVLVMNQGEDGSGRIFQQGSYEELLNQPGAFQNLISRFGSAVNSRAQTPVDRKASMVPTPKQIEEALLKDDQGIEHQATPENPKLVLEEEKAQGFIGWEVYRRYAQAIRPWPFPLLILAFLLLSQAATVYNTVFLGFWSEDKYDGLTQGRYMSIYGGLGAMMALFSLGAIFTTLLAGIGASYTLFNRAWSGVIRSSSSWHDRTPTGRIINRLSKDTENIDDRLSDVWYLVASAALSIAGTFGLILYVYPWIALLFIPVLLFNYLAFSYYRVTTRDLVRLASTARSHVYSNFGEQLSGSSVIRAFRQQENFELRLGESIDTELATVMCGNFAQGRWTGIRISFVSYLLILSVAVFGVMFRHTVPPSRFGVVLTYVIATASTLTSIIALMTEIEQQMNNVERILSYGDLSPEGPPQLPSDPNPSTSWPAQGAISFHNVNLRYREKIGVMGRTGAGKSSITQALFRTVEISDGRIDIDGRDIRNLGVDTLRQRLSVIPQEAFVFGGTVRDNIDPTGTRSDAELSDSINIVCVNASDKLKSKFRLDAVVKDGGSNFSTGEKQLLALVRALNRHSKILVLGEATSSVDFETDALIRSIINKHFAGVTVISIAHRIQTVAYCDRIMVMDAGAMAEFDSPLQLYDRSVSIFRKLCDKGGLARTDLVELRSESGMTEEAAHAADPLRL
ncbi:hypothetical protein I350_03577 [Cryptococcus amylolentus CBS 6273]|uniref:Multidrug resistance-associated protein 1 n=1 Tax=Cryptococcus amylolentus CBS 6273 TaxID=1296118 RepID=A0A1E3K496_9TREE|nr:hypothetical protein I350_03577 [Cryptococcus amylolentus CBS 6273]